nr:RNA-directed DNA polymerase, eukaryota, nucleotide-binding alpha-beta plait domain protein [Tanacetum cinerariifolium]
MGEDWQEVPTRDLWKSCSVYGTVVNVFIPSKKSKAGKRFAFVRFIKVFNLDRLVENLCTIWIGRYHLYVDSVRFEQSYKSFLAPTANAAEVPKKSFVPQYSNAWPCSYANVVNGESPSSYGSLLSTSPAMVLEDTCLVVRDLSKHVMGKVKDFTAIPRLYTILKDEEVFGDVYGSDDDGVPETVFGSNTSSPNQVDGGKENFKSEDPFGIYDMLSNKKDNVTSESRPSLSHPLGFTPEGTVHHEMLGTINGEADNNGGKDNLVPVSARVMNTSQDIPKEMHSDSVGSKTVHNGGSMLGVMEDFI